MSASCLLQEQDLYQRVIFYGSMVGENFYLVGSLCDREGRNDVLGVIFFVLDLVVGKAIVFSNHYRYPCYA